MPDAPSTSTAAPSQSEVDRAWQRPPDNVLNALGVTREGLAAEAVRQRRDRLGPNTLRETKDRGIAEILVDQLKSLVVLLLVAAAGVALFFGDLPEAIAIGVVLVVNTAIGFFMEWRAVQSMKALRELSDVPAVVRRAGQVQQIDAEDLVPGDIVLLDEGDMVTADLRLLDASKLQIDESALTGESVPVDKAEDAAPAEAPLAERSSMVYKGTAVTRGAAEAVVVATGMETELGEISALVDEAESEETPLEERLDQLARSLVGVVLVLGAAVTAIGVITGRDLKLMIETGIALAVAAIPEGLPIVATIALARGLRRMARRNALVRRLSSVETLGATSLICTDKTGTLTENQMTVQRIDGPAGSIAFAAGDSTFSRAGQPLTPSEDVVLARTLQVAALCNSVASASASGDDSGNGRAPAPAGGDPMETALVDLARAGGYNRGELLARWPEVSRDAFDRATKKMATLHETEDGVFVAVKGAPEAVLESCAFEAQEDDGAIALSDARRQHWIEQNETLANDGLRILALAMKRTDSPETDPYSDLRFLGLVGLLDPPRSDVRPAIARCRHAGIRVVMVTGDQAPTALYVARAVDLAADDAVVVQGQDVATIADADAATQDRIRAASVLARVTPRQKLDLIDLHQADGRIVAMTGDGVNDAPALKSADIGIAMGQRGTQVAQEAADMVLKDDAFSTIVTAVEEGRAIFRNIQNFVYYLMSCNVGEVMVVGLASLTGVLLPLLPLQILFLNLVTDVFPALALGMSEAESEVMDEPPRSAQEPILARTEWAGIALYGAAFTVSVLGTLLIARYGLGRPPETSVTISFFTLAFGQLWHVFNMRTPTAHPVRNAVTTNPYVWGAIAICVALLFAAIHLPVIAKALSIVSLTTTEWALALGGSLVPFLAGQTYLLTQYLRADGSQHADSRSA